jgi:hypothetical protein
MRRAVIAAFAVLSILVGGCGSTSQPSSDPDEYAGLTRSFVETYYETKIEQGGGGAVLSLEQVRQDQNDAGRPVWLGVFRDLTTNEQVCIQTYRVGDNIHNSEPFPCGPF